LQIAYDGTNYHGFASQADEDVETIEGALNNAISSLTGESISVIGASRTDAGVHAYGNIAVFDTASTIPADRFFMALNTKLPADIRAITSYEVQSDFHPRHTNSKKTYVYRIFNGDIMPPVLNNHYEHCSFDIDIDIMKSAGGYLIGEHDFTSFCSVNTQSPDHVRKIYDVDVCEIPYELNVLGDVSDKKNQKIIEIRVTGNGFLYNMVRIIAGTLIDFGIKNRNPEEIIDILSRCDRSAAGPTAPACGLYLIGYEYI